MTLLLGSLLLLCAVIAAVARSVPAAARLLLATAALSPYLMLGAPAAAVMFTLGRHWVPAAVAAVATAAAIAFLLPLRGRSPRPASGVTVRFVSANLLMGKADPEAVARLAREHADVIAVQELTPELAEALSSALAQDFPHCEQRPKERASGVGLWSRYPITASGADGSFTRGFLWARIRLPGTDAEPTFISTHMPPPRSAFPSWRADIVRLGPTLRELPATGPVIAGGDLNATPDVVEFRRLLGSGGYRSGAAQAGAGRIRTYPNHLRRYGIPPMLALDHVLTRKATVTAIRAVAVAGSDHRAVAATVVVD